ncbi:hypothetical protein EPJ70_01640 [Brachyspira aalborgi]|uniref:Uncharacterized protein n=1 Tax=Brachyspira aalborgi TaxID=29522 RepID=A0A5C8F8V6_9SPIR|nr:hypothetical protein [Brachyspira aalborgi]TXJ46426.1 hypothetical protein EPJ70_01640 [Brachyspira aalborgi]
MLNNEDKEKIIKYIDKINYEILDRFHRNINVRIPKKQVIDDIIKTTVNKFTPESKIIITKVYNLMADRTLAEPMFQNANNGAAFYKMDVERELKEKFNFEIPSKIEYEESERKINEWIKAGIITIIGGVISISLKKASPIIVAVVIAGIMTVINKNKENNKKEDLTALVKEYLESVKQSLLSWVDSIAEYYDERVNELKKELENKNK